MKKKKDKCVASLWFGAIFSGRTSWSPLNNSQCSEVSLGNLLTVFCDLRLRYYSPTDLVIMILSFKYLWEDTERTQPQKNTQSQPPKERIAEMATIPIVHEDVGE